MQSNLGYPALMFVLGGGTIWLALREFTPSFRIVTIVWGICLTAFFAFAAFSAFDPSDVGGVIFYGGMLLVTAPIPILAIPTPAHLVADGAPLPLQTKEVGEQWVATERASGTVRQWLLTRARPLNPVVRQ